MNQKEIEKLNQEIKERVKGSDILEYYRTHTTKETLNKYGIRNKSQLLKILKSMNYDFVFSVNGSSLGGSKQIYDAIVEKGDYDTWFECMMKMRTNVPTRLAFGASAVSPLLTILGSPCFVTMLYGQTGTGKTLSCRCAVSMWGNPDVLSTRADSTPTSIIRKCLFFNNLTANISIY
mgnify:CR=1 FL=1